MKTLKFLVFAVLALSMGMACSDFVTPRQEPDNSQEPDLLKSKLLGEWVVANQKSSYIYAFADNDTVYTKTPEGDTIDRWLYQSIAADSIRIIRNDWTTHNKVVFYSNDSIRINDFIPSDAAVYPPLFGDAVLIRFIATPPTEEKPELSDAKWKLFGIFDVQNNSLKALNPVDCEECYALNFDTDSTATGKSSTNLVWVDLSKKEKLIGIATETGEREDGHLFCDAVESVTSYSCNGNELKFFYNEDRYYLLYYRIFDGMESGFIDTNELSGTGYVFADSVPSELQNKKNIMYIIYNETTRSATFSAIYPEAFYNGDILNFSESTKGWKIPAEGIQINYAGVFYEGGRYLMGYPLVGGYLVLTKLKDESSPVLTVENPLEELPWLKAEVDEITLAIQNGNPLSVSIYQCVYGNSETGFLVDKGNIKPFYNCSGEILCIMGGDAGETCSELNIVSKKLIWKMKENNGNVTPSSIHGKWKRVEEEDAWDHSLIHPVDYYAVWEFFPDGTIKYYYDSDNTDESLKTYELKSDSLYLYYDNIKEECCTFIYRCRFIDAEKNKIKIEYLQGNKTDIMQPLLWIYERVDK